MTISAEKWCKIIQNVDTLLVQALTVIHAHRKKHVYILVTFVYNMMSNQDDLLIVV